MPFLRALAEVGANSKPGDPIRFVASTGGVKRDGLDLDQRRWRLGNYERNPVVLWAHDYFGQRPPIGKASVSIDNDRLIADVVFDQADEFARTIEHKYRNGFLNAVSVGWDDVRIEDEPGYDLLDISAVPVPGDPDALMERQARGYARLREDLDLVLGERSDVASESGRDGPVDGVVDGALDVVFGELERIFN